MTTIIVDALSDTVDAGDGLTSLREAVLLANATNGTDRIVFDDTIANGLIRLTQGEISITEDLTIDALGAGITITGDANDDDLVLAGTDLTDVAASGAALLDDNSRIFSVSGNSTELVLAGLTLTGGRTTGANDEGGAVFSEGIVELFNASFVGNSTTGRYASGGAVAAYTVSATNTSFTGNGTIGYQARGAAVFGYYGLTLQQSTVTGNSTTGQLAPGAASTRYGTLNVANSIVTGNAATAASYSDLYSGIGGPYLDGNNIIGSQLQSTNPPLTVNLSPSDVFVATAEVLDGNGIGTGVFGGVIDPAAGAGGHVALLAGGAADGAGDEGVLPTDALDLDGDGDTGEDLPVDATGAPRIQFGALDLGAVETPAPPSIDFAVVNAVRLNAGESSLVDRIEFAHDAALSPTGSWTVEAWVETTDTDNQFNRIVRKVVGGAQTYSLVVKDGQAHIRFDKAGGGAFQVQTGPLVADGELHHLVGVYNDPINQLILYVDGKEVGRTTTNGTPTQGTGPLAIGGTTGVPSQFFDGTVHEVRVWDDVRTLNEIIFSNTGLDPAAEPNLQLQLTFPDGVPTDQSTNGFTPVVAGSLDPAFGLIADQLENPVPGISVDFAGTGTIEVDLAVTGGATLEVTPVAGLAITGNGTGSLTLVGTEQAINSALATLVVFAVFSNSGPETLSIEAAQPGSATQQAEVPLWFTNSPDGVILVDTLNDVVDAGDGVTSLREALVLANQDSDETTILFDPSLSGGTITLDSGLGRLEIFNDISIDGDVDGDDAADITISGGGTSGLFNVVSNVSASFSSLTLTGGNGTNGAAIYSTGSLTVENSTFTENLSTASTADEGGGAIAQIGGSATIRSSTFEGNSTNSEGGGDPKHRQHIYRELDLRWQPRR